MSILAGTRIVTPEGILDPGWIEINGAVIERLGTGTPPLAADHELNGSWLVPGFVDIHAHGGDGASFGSGDLDDARRIAAFHLNHGTTTIVASVITAPLDTLETALSRLADLTDDGLIAGTHLEGPFLNPVRRGAHAGALLRQPDREVLDRLLRAGRGRLRMITLAPELDSGIDAVRQVVDFGSTAAIGHTDATYDIAKASIAAGVRVATHLYNGMRPVHHREPGPVVAVLEDDRVTVEVINDGVHVHPSIVHTIATAAGSHRMALISDASTAAGLDNGRRSMQDPAIGLRDGVTRPSDQTKLAGSTVTLDHGFRTAAQQFGIEAAVAMVSSTPAKALDFKGVGEIVPGTNADLVALDRGFNVNSVMKSGQWVDGSTL